MTTRTGVIFVIDGVAYHSHPNGGGLVAETATVAPTVFVAEKAMVLDQACLKDCVRVTGFAQVGGTVKASGHVTFAGKSVTREGKFRGHKLIHDRMRKK